MPARRAEYAAVRECARTALRRLGLADAAVPAGPDRAPVWPAGIVGSMTHVDGYRAAAVGRAETWAGIGIDAEVHAPLPPGVATLVMSQDERAALARTDPALCLDRVLFSAKESVYKVWYPVTRSWLGFEDVDVRLGDGTFVARIGRHRARDRRAARSVGGRRRPGGHRGRAGSGLSSCVSASPWTTPP